MPKLRRKLPKGIHVHESGSVYICYKNEHGSIIRENTHQTDVNAAKLTLTGAGIEDNIIGLLTGHKSRELRRYQHLREELKRKTVDLIAGVLKEAGEPGNNASSSRLLHAGKNNRKKAAPKGSK